MIRKLNTECSMFCLCESGRNSHKSFYQFTVIIATVQMFRIRLQQVVFGLCLNFLLKIIPKLKFLIFSFVLKTRRKKRLSVNRTDLFNISFYLQIKLN